MLRPLLLAASAGLTAAIYSCPAPKTPLPKKFQGSWGVSFGPTPTGAVDFTTANAYWTAATPGNLLDTYFCLTDTKESSAGVAQLNIGDAANAAGKQLMYCAQLNITDAPASINFHIEYAASKCPAAEGGSFEDHTQWTPGGRGVPQCPSVSPLVPASMVGNGSMVPVGYSGNSFLSVDGHSWSLVNEGALVTAWCANKRNQRAGGITELQFCNNPAGSVFCVGGQPGAGESQDAAPPAAPGPALLARQDASKGRHRQLQFGPGVGFGPGRGCAWARKHSADSLEWKWGSYLMNGTAICPTNMSNSHVMPFTFSGGDGAGL